MLFVGSVHIGNNVSSQWTNMCSSSWGFITFYLSRFKDVFFVCPIFAKENILISQDSQYHCFLSSCCFHLISLIKSNCGLHCWRVIPRRIECQAWFTYCSSWSCLLNIPRTLIWTTSSKSISKPYTWPSFSQEDRVAQKWTLSCFAVTVSRDRITDHPSRIKD